VVLGHISGDHRLTRVYGQAAGQRVWADPEAIDALGVRFAHADDMLQLGTGVIGDVEGASDICVRLCHRGAGEHTTGGARFR